MARIANRYAKALYQFAGSDLAKAKKLRESFQGVTQLFKVKESEKVLRSPVMPVSLKKSLLDYGLDQSQSTPEVRVLVQTLLESGRIGLLPEVAQAYGELLDQAEGVVKAELQSAVALTDGDTKAIGDALSKMLKKKVEIKPTVDPSLLGGFVAKVGNYLVDMSLKTKLDGLSQTAVQDSIR